MIPLTHVRGRRVALFGLGVSGLATAQALRQGGAQVLAWDDHQASRDAAWTAGFQVEDLRNAAWPTFDSFILSPGVPLTHPVSHWTVPLARAAGVEIIGDIELFCRERRATAPRTPFIAITGTNGKSTTTALTAHLLREAGQDVQMGGNIGVPILALEPPREDRVYVIECSSYQIDLAPSLDPSVGVHLNISSDHIDRHGTIEHYAAVKERVVSGASQCAVVGVDDPFSAAMVERAARKGQRVMRISVQTELESGMFLKEGALWICIKGTCHRLVDLASCETLRGRHNAQNAAAACAAVLALGYEPLQLQGALQSFPGLPHRMQLVGRRGSVSFVNDSKATNADAAAKALASYDTIYWIAGGRAKTDGIESLRPFFPRIRHAYLIGEALHAFAGVLEGTVPVTPAQTMASAVRAAAHDAQKDTAKAVTVLLSPACASFDQYKNFEERGEDFVTHVQDVLKDVP